MIINIFNTYCQIDEATQLDLVAAKRALSYKDENAHFIQSAWNGVTCLLNKKNQFPTGLIHRLVKELKESECEYKIKDCRVRPEKQFNFALREPFTPRDYQAACRPLTKVKQRGVFLAGTGAGKSFMSAIVVDEIGLQTLVVTPDTGLQEQLMNDYIKKFFNEDLVGSKLTDDKPIIVANIQSIAKADPKLFLRFGCLVIDEYHHAGAKSYRVVSNNCKNAFYRYGFTGTFVRPSGDEMEMHGVLSQVIMRITTSELIRRGFLTRPLIKMIEFNLDKNKYKTKRYQEAYNMLIEEPDIHSMIATIISHYVEKNKQVLIVTKRIEHARLISEMIPGAVFLSGQSKDREAQKQRFINREINCICATNIFGEGIDIPVLDVFANLRFEKTEIHTKQGVGRCLRNAEGKKFAVVLDFLINGHRNLKDHSNKRLSSYQSETEFDIELVKDYTELFTLYDAQF